MRDNRVVATLEVEAIALAGVATGGLLIAVLSFALILTGWCMKCLAHNFELFHLLWHMLS